ncbi:MAG TPA: dicarboxylate/amino acid:cation symporter [Myxococcota bacterium]|nr:dicarboxylate/amino acid:cation symporter [Myxococcota bacterium]
MEARSPLALRVVVGVAIGVAAGAWFRTDPIALGLTTGDLGPIGMLVIRLLKALATPLILVAILDSFLKTSISARSGARLLAVCAVNVSVAMAIGGLLLNLLRPGDRWAGHLDALGLASTGAAPARVEASLSPLKNLAGFVPESVVDPFARNLVISVVLLAVLFGAALRRVRDLGEHPAAMQTVEHLIEVAYAALTTALLWVAETMPFAVALIVSDVVGKAGVGVFQVLWVFFATILSGLLLHALVYYPLSQWALSGRSPWTYLRGALDAVVTAVSCNSSLATMPVTLRCLRQLGVRDEAARLSACVGTNFNNDGIMLYEAMATLFLCQALGMPQGLGGQLTVAASAVMAGVGIAGIPEAGLIILPLVLTAVGVPDAAVAAAIPLVVPVDWVLARVRSGVNVLADMQVAIALDALEPREAGAPRA